MKKEINSSPGFEHYKLVGDNQFPNNEVLSVLVYRDAFELPEKNAADIIDKTFKENQWENSWRNGIYDYHHYHSTAHEVLGVYQGKCTVLLGGDNGITLKIAKGDVLILPAGVAHKNVGSSDDFKCVGAYPEGQDYDMNYGKPGERPKVDENIKKVPLPEMDPVYGYDGKLITFWEMQ